VPTAPAAAPRGATAATPVVVDDRVTVGYRTLGGTGIRVSTLTLGTMMFGAWGNPDPSECAAMVHRAPEPRQLLLGDVHKRSFP
jgi:hypothetical protein